MTTKPTPSGHWKDLSIGYEEALARFPAALKKEGFGIITEIDFKETLKAKLGVDFRRYRIIGACNPGFAHAALESDLQLGLLLPCNFVLYETDDGKAVVGAVDPMQTLGASSSDPRLGEIGRDVDARLLRVIAGIDT